MLALANSSEKFQKILMNYRKFLEIISEIMQATNDSDHVRKELKQWQ